MTLIFSKKTFKTYLYTLKKLENYAKMMNEYQIL